MTDAAPDFDSMFADLCTQVGFCLHEKGQKKVIRCIGPCLTIASVPPQRRQTCPQRP